MTRLGKLWTGAVAYVSLGVGAGLSVAGNLADTYRTRGAATDTLDRFLAAGWPLLVLLAIEMFVSPRWSSKRMFQAWRWLGCLAVGGMAMVVSWTHLHDLMASRGQLDIVAILGPLAIDGMAIMATGLILSTRTRGHADTATMSKPVSGHEVDMDTIRDRWTSDMSNPSRVQDITPAVAMATEPGQPWPEDMSDLMSWTDGHDRAVSQAAEDMVSEIERELSGATTVPRVPVVSGMPDEARELIGAWEPSALPWPDAEKLLAGHFGKSTRTIRRWRAMVLGPVSAPPAGGE